jgi:hypothetical protein
MTFRLLVGLLLRRLPIPAIRNHPRKHHGLAVLLFLAEAFFAAAAFAGDAAGIPCRVRDGRNPDMFMMTLGDVRTQAEQGKFFPDEDCARLYDGTVIHQYYRDTLGIQFYKPIDKSVFALPPCGWCSWYFYFNEVSGDEVRRNARWLADNLKDYGLEYVQIDDGWQGVGRGFNSNRDWTTINDRFPGGMKELASSIKKLGFKPGLWIAPHGQSNPVVIQVNKRAFLLKADGKTASDTWEGTYLVDPSTEEGHAYLRHLFGRLSDWGYEYFKIDGQPCVIDEYRRCADLMQKPSKGSVELYRGTLQTIRNAIGPQRYLLGCWETPREGIGMTHGWRTGADVVPGWDGFRIALDATMSYYFLHNVVMYCDPDTVMVHQPLTIEQARMWATLQGLTGQALMASDRMMDLSDERVELYRRIYPAADIRPLDLFPSQRNKHIWDLKIKDRDRDYDVLGLFNYDDSSPRQFYLNWQDLGLAEDLPMHVYDFWNNEYLGAYKKGYCIEVPPASCKVLTLLPATKEIQLISTNRHITQGWPDLLGVKHDASGLNFHGTSRVIKNDPYRMTFVFPPGTNYAITQAVAESLPTRVSNHSGWAMVEIVPPKTTEISWKVDFAPEPAYHFPCNNPGGLAVALNGLDQATVKWSLPGTSSVGAFLVSLDGDLLGATRCNSFPLGSLCYGKTHTVQVVTSWNDGTVSTQKVPSLAFTMDAMARKDYALPELYALQPSPDSRIDRLMINQSAAGKPLSLAGKKYASGLGCKSGIPIEYNLHGRFGRFTALVGVDDSGNNQGVLFTVEGDGKELYRSQEIRKHDEPHPISVDVTGVERLVLRASTASMKTPTEKSSRSEGNLVDWCDAKVEAKPRNSIR